MKTLSNMARTTQQRMSLVQDAPTFKPLKTGNRGAELRERGERGPEKMLTAVQ